MAMFAAVNLRHCLCCGCFVDQRLLSKCRMNQLKSFVISDLSKVVSKFIGLHKIIIMSQDMWMKLHWLFHYQYDDKTQLILAMLAE